jgi:hypothetical protein
MSSTSAEYESDMLEAVKILEEWKEFSPELNKAIKIIKDTIWWENV